MRTGEFGDGDDAAWPEATIVIAISADPYHRAAVAYGREISVVMAERFVERELLPITPHATFRRRADLEWIVTLTSDGPDLEQFITASRIRLGSHLIDVDGQTTFLDLCMGIAVAEQIPDASSTEELVRCADAALCFALIRQHHVVVADEQTLPLVHMQVDIGNRLARSAESDFLVYYQPIVNLTDTQPVGFESLLRWRSGNAILTPASFLMAAQATSLIVPIGQHALADAVTTLAREVTPAFGANSFVAVNLSGQQLWVDGVVDFIDDLLRSNGIAPQRLWVEVREDEVIRLGTAAAQAIQDLHDIGCTMCVDDLGAGYSALRYLRDLPIDVVKVDRSLISGLVDSPADRAVVKAICEISRAYGMVPLAEGVETEETLAELTGLGFEMAQGYLFGKPESAEVQFRQ
ncbi:EAL domain-containing protein [Gordonia sp. OPL2]|uniref:EAL domain-containing protein n=1 Tax=Gordonia sp. OPL2 TaxID=2486274 RepID=UPI001654C908|nr:EAL domain-containing protein [Gordonia sp. OPL2]ROZ83715.1 EAL domain-containing protein [Gordonia sp. OPL2]